MTWEASLRKDDKSSEVKICDMESSFSVVPEKKKKNLFLNEILMAQEFKVRYVTCEPFSINVPDGNGVKLEGALRDILDALSHSLKYQFPTMSQEDHQVGSLQSDGNFSGMFGALQRKETHIVGPFVLSEQRALVADFSNTVGFSTLGVITGIMSADRNMFLYANVFYWKVWLALLATIIALGFVAALIYNVTVDGWKHDQVGLLLRYFWVFWSYLIGQDGTTTTHWTQVKIWNLQSFRILLAAWLLGPVINFSFSFQGSITSTFAIAKMKPVVNSLEELSLKTRVVPVLAKGSVVQLYFQGSPAHTHLWKRMKDNLIEFTPTSLERTLEKIENGTHILITDYIYAMTIASEYVKRKRRCSVQVEEMKFYQNFIILGLRKDMPRKIQKNINTRLTYIIQAKLADRWMNRVFPNYTHCTKQPQEDSKPLSVTDILGGFLI